jgi:hypothetical protein
VSVVSEHSSLNNVRLPWLNQWSHLLLTASVIQKTCSTLKREHHAVFQSRTKQDQRITNPMFSATRWVVLISDYKRLCVNK